MADQDVGGGMLNHIVLFRRKPEVAADPVREAALVARMAALDEQIDHLRSWKLSANELSRPVCWDYVLETRVDDVTALDAYLYHPAHVALVADLKQYFEWAAADYTVAAG
jgi:hypothetical protein